MDVQCGCVRMCVPCAFVGVSVRRDATSKQKEPGLDGYNAKASPLPYALFTGFPRQELAINALLSSARGGSSGRTGEYLGAREKREDDEGRGIRRGSQGRI